MYCPSCGKAIPEDGAFCLHCGAQVLATGAAAAAAPKEPIEYEYQDFVHTWPEKQRPWIQISGGGYTVPAARLTFWQDYQRLITDELQQWLDAGWEPVGEVGPGSIELREYRALRYNWFGWLMFIILTILTFYLLGIFAYFTRPWYAEPTEFRVRMRRPMVYAEEEEVS